MYRPRRRSGGWIGWFLSILLLGCVGAFVYYLYLPLRHTRARLDGELAQAAGREKNLNQRLKQADGRFALLEQQCKKVSGELAQTVAEKDKIEAELKRVLGELSEKLDPEIKTGNVRIRRRGQELVLDMADQILFDTGQAAVSEGGQKVLMQVGHSLAQLPTYAIQVGGHTDGTRVVTPATQERFPTNWELSAARATNVVRFLQERSKIPGQRLVAAGFAEFRPAASNATDEGRQQNRRIEVVLLPRTGSQEATIH
jgi:chemotaxis protein MotB